VQEDIKSPVAPIREPGLNTRVILVKESPKKLQPSHEEKENQFDDGDSNKQASNQKGFLDIGGGGDDDDDDDVVLGASSGSKEIMKSGADDKHSFETVVGQFPSPSYSATELIKGMHYILTQAFQFQ
jgi:hypothetical protein